MRYQSRNPRAATSPLRSIPLSRPAAEVFGAAWHAGTWNQPTPIPLPAAFVSPTVNPARELANAEAALSAAVRVYDFARRAIGDANATRSAPVLMNGRLVIPAKAFTPERIRERKSCAFRLFNQRRGQLADARRRVDAARAIAGLPSLAVVEKRVAIAAVLRASKRVPVCRLDQSAHVAC